MEDEQGPDSGRRFEKTWKKGEATGLATTRDFIAWSTRMLRHDISGEEKDQKQEHSKEGEQDGQSEQRSHRQQKIRELIRDLYKEYNPSKLDDVDNLMKRYNGHERSLYRAICAKYLPPELSKVPSKVHWSSLVPPWLRARISSGPPSSSTASGPEEAGAAYRLKAEARFQATTDLQDACVAICVDFDLSDEVLVLMRVSERKILEALLSNQILRKKLAQDNSNKGTCNKEVPIEKRMRWLCENLDKELPMLIEHTGSLLDEERRAKRLAKERAEKKPRVVLRTREEVSGSGPV